MRTDIITIGEFFHVYNRGVEKRPIFMDDHDRERFLLSMFVLRHNKSFHHPIRPLAPQYLSIQDIQIQSSNITTLNKISNKIKQIEEMYLFKEKLVEIIAFCLMNNHFHLMLKEISRNGISKYMHRFGTSYTKYFNTRYERTGHLLGSRFKAEHVDRNEYLTYLSRYIHTNPKKILSSNNNLSDYKWSSYPDYIKENRWGEALQTDIVLNQFFNKQEYKNYVESVSEVRL